MHRLRTLSVSFDTHINPWELPRFRGAVARKVGLEHEWYHNHNNETGGYHQRYPLIQYKLDSHNGQIRPMLLCLDQGIEEAHHFFSQPDWGLRIGEQQHDMRVAKIDLRQHTLYLSDTPMLYRIHKWKPFNTESHEHWLTLRGIAEQFAFLERVLVSHIIAFANGVEWQIPERFDVKITDLLKKEWIDYKSVKMLAFTMEFETNVSLPDFIGLGKSSALGFGVVRKQRQTTPVSENRNFKTHTT